MRGLACVKPAPGALRAAQGGSPTEELLEDAGRHLHFAIPRARVQQRSRRNVVWLHAKPRHLCQLQHRFPRLARSTQLRTAAVSIIRMSWTTPISMTAMASCGFRSPPSSQRQLCTWVILLVVSTLTAAARSASAAVALARTCHAVRLGGEGGAHGEDGSAQGQPESEPKPLPNGCSALQHQLLRCLSRCSGTWRHDPPWPCEDDARRRAVRPH
jgi:hypothetical protein